MANYKIHDHVCLLTPAMISFGENCRIDSFVKIEGGRGVHIGKHVHIASFSHVNIGGGYVFISDGVALASGSKIVSGGNTLDGLSMSAVSPPDQQVVKRGQVMIGFNACVLTNAVVMPGVHIGDYSIIGAGSVLRSDVPPWEVWAGVPAKKIRDRDRL
jgi:galactoside O-acetyltransferase